MVYVQKYFQTVTSNNAVDDVIGLSVIIEIELREGPMEGQQDRPISQHCLWMLWLMAFRN